MRCSPPTVRRLIVPVRIDSVDRVRRSRAQSHVGIERSEVVPALAHGHASSAVVPEADGAAVSAPVQHVLPDPVLGGALGVVGHGCRPVCAVEVGGAFPLVAPARPCFAAAQMPGAHRPFGTAVASCQPIRRRVVAAVFSRFSQYRPASKSLSGQVQAWRHSIRVAADSLRPTIAWHSFYFLTIALNVSEA